jgi:alpha-L-rhamnosidase
MTRQWTGEMIAPDEDFAGAPLLRREVTLADGHGAVVRARLYATALGVFEAYVNGSPAGDDVLSPGWSAYEWRLRYREYDVTHLVEASTVLGFAVGNGWYRGRLGFQGGRAFYGDELAVLAELEVAFADGYTQLVVTDGDWRCGPSATVANDLYDGQRIDARLRDDTWTRPGARLSGWTGVHRLDFDHARLTPYLGPPVRRQETLSPVKVWTSPAGRTLVDFGQNLVGWVRCTVSGPAGTVITLRHAEVLEHGELGVRPLRTAKATDEFVLSGGTDTFEPTMTFHGFRYVEVDGWPGELSGDELTAVVVHSELAPIGTFECSDPMLNQLHRNVVWGMRGNVLDVPTDCPQRDERLGWTGDLAVFAPTAAYLYDMSGFLDDWMADLAAEQSAAGGRVPFVIPDVFKYEQRPPDFPQPESPALWSDAAAWVPWALWQAYGDRAALARQYPAMAAHVRHVAGLLSPTGLWDQGFQFGDWLDPQAPPDNPFQARADPGVVATACFYRTLDIATRAATILDRSGDAADFAALRDRVRAAFADHYVFDAGSVHSDCPTVYALAIVFGLLDNDRLGPAGDRLAELVAAGGYRAASGFAGTPYVLDALSATGHLDAAYRMLLQTECPSWLYPIGMGATTVWERWDSMLPDGTINPGQMTSFNHYAFGAVADWMHRTIAGIEALAPGYATVLVAPRPGGGITAARAELRTPRGTVRTEWTVNAAGLLLLAVSLPAGTTGVVRLPGREEVPIGAGEHRLSANLAAPESRAVGGW